MLPRIIAITVVFICTTIAWAVLGATIHSRTYVSDTKLRGKVASTWGGPHVQKPPRASYRVVKEQKPRPVLFVEQLPAVQNRVEVRLDLEHRRKGLLWYSTYAVGFRGEYTFRNTDPAPHEVEFRFPLPNDRAVYDGLSVSLDGRALPLQFEDKSVVVSAPIAAETSSTFAVAYKSQGLESWQYTFGDAVAGVDDFALTMRTNFADIDFHEDTLSPTQKTREASGWKLQWQYARLVSGVNIAMEMPEKLQPGQLAASISYFAPVSLFFFFFLMLMITIMRGIDLHPMNYFFLAAAFFAFHLLLAYLVDHISIHAAFGICSVVSIALVVSYLRIVVGPAFAFREAALSQFVYLVLFSYAFFFEGFTGLAVTIGAILTLFIVMHLTARVRWSDHFSAHPASLPLLNQNQ